jgi:transcriptional regulator with XRE-family HTH domain
MKHPKPNLVPRTKGRDLLARWFEADRTRTRAGLGERLGISGQAVSGWLRAVARPEEGRLRDLLEHATAIPADSWLTKREVEDRAKQVARARGDVAAQRLTGT